MKVNQKVITVILMLLAPAVSGRRYCTALGDCKVIPGWGDISPREFQKRNSIMDHMSEILSIPVRMNSLFEQQQRQLSKMYHQTAPRYDISEDDQTMELALDLPGVHESDVSLTLLEGDTVLKITGSRKYKHYGQIVSTEFDQMFRIDPTVLDVDKIEARLSDGVLVISAPKFLKNHDIGERRIPITGSAKESEENLEGEEGKKSHESEQVSHEEYLAELSDDLEITEEDMT